jgi:hypothetical protein
MSKTKSRRRRKPMKDTPVTIRLPRQTLKLIEKYRAVYACTRSDIVRAWITYALHAVNTDAAEMVAA